MKQRIHFGVGPDPEDIDFIRRAQFSNDFHKFSALCDKLHARHGFQFINLARIKLGQLDNLEEES